MIFSKHSIFYAFCTHFYFYIKVSFEVLINTLVNLGLTCLRKRAQLPDSLEGKTVVITGANSGIGRECARTCLRLGAKVVLACRDLKKAQTAAEEMINEAGPDSAANLILIELNLASLASIRKAAAEIHQKVTQIDVLLNNAGVTCPDAQKTADNFELQLGTNYLGHFLLTHLLLDKLLKTTSSLPTARIVNLSSLGHTCGRIHFENLNLSTGEYRQFRAYSQSKLANVLFTAQLHRMLVKSGKNHVKVYAVHPGVVNTGMTQNYPSSVSRSIRLQFLEWITLDSDLGAQTSLHCALSEEAAHQSGFYYE